MFWRRQRRLRAAATTVSAAKRAPRAAWERLEARQLMSVAPGWSAAVGGCTVSYEHLYPEAPDSVGVVRVTGTAGDDVMTVAEAVGNPHALLLTLNGADYTLDLSDLSAGFHSIVLDGAAGNDRLASTVSYAFAAGQGGSMWGVELHGGDGNDVLSGGTCAHALSGDAGDDVIVGGDGRNFINGGAGDDTLFGHGLAYDGHGTDPTYDFLDGGAGDDVIHGGACGFATVGDGSDLTFDGYAASVGSHLVVHGTAWDQPAEYTAGDPLLASAGGRPIALVGDVLVLTGTAGDDHVSLSLDAAGGTMTVSVNGTSAAFDAAAVGRYLFDSRGGTDALNVSGGGDTFVHGWVLRSANPADSVTVSANSAAEPVLASADGAATLRTLSSPETLTPREIRAARRQELLAAKRALRAARIAARQAARAARLAGLARADRGVPRWDNSAAAITLSGLMPTVALFSQISIR